MSKKRAVKRRNKRNARPAQHVWMARVANVRRLRIAAFKEQQAIEQAHIAALELNKLAIAS